MNLIITMEVLELANIKSAKKRILVAEKRAEKNKSVRSRVKTAVKKVDAAIAANDKAALQTAIANVKSAEAKLATAKLTADSKAELYKEQVVSEFDLQTARNEQIAAEAALKAAVSELDKATKKGIYHKNTTARKVSRLTIAVNKLA